MEELLGWVSKDFGRLQAWISSGNTSTSKGRQFTLPNDQFRKVNFTLPKFRKGIFLMVRNLAISHHDCEISQGGFSPCEIWTLDLSPCENAFEIPCFETLLMIFHYRFSKIFCLTFSFVNTYFTLVINQWKGCFCNSSCNLAFYCLQIEVKSLRHDHLVTCNFLSYKSTFVHTLLFSFLSHFLSSQTSLEDEIPKDERLKPFSFLK